jgi:hypothetical protein
MGETTKLNKYRCECGRLLLVEGCVIGTEYPAAPDSVGSPQKCPTCGSDDRGKFLAACISGKADVEVAHSWHESVGEARPVYRYDCIACPHSTTDFVAAKRHQLAHEAKDQDRSMRIVEVGEAPAAQINVKEMPINRACGKCGWTHAVGSDCPARDAVFVTSHPATANAREDMTLSEAKQRYPEAPAPAQSLYEAPPKLETEYLVMMIARELYDRFVMGGWEPQDAYPQIRRWLEWKPGPNITGKPVHEWGASLADEKEAAYSAGRQEGWEAGKQDVIHCYETWQPESVRCIHCGGLQPTIMCTADARCPKNNYEGHVYEFTINGPDKRLEAIRALTPSPEPAQKGKS